MAGSHNWNREGRKQGEVRRMKCPAPFLLMAATLLGCVSDIPEDGVVALQYRKLFEAGRRAEFYGNVKIAEDTYGWLIERDNRYGEYGLAVLQFRRGDASGEAVKHLLSCAKRSVNDSAMDSAFSAAAMVKLTDIAASEHHRPDIAASLHDMAFRIITPKVRAWAEEMKADVDYEAAYRDVISAVESSCQSREHSKALTWNEISKVFLNEESDNGAFGDKR